MPKKYDHIHKLELVALGKDYSYFAYRCVLPKCTYLVNRKLAMGKESQCWKCHETLILSPKFRNTKRPKCDNCRSNSKVSNKPSALPIVLNTSPSLVLGGHSKKMDEDIADELLDLLVTKQ
jgi:hypothetical protein